MLVRSLVFLFLCCGLSAVHSQTMLSQEHSAIHEFNRFLEQRTSDFHTAVKPYNSLEVERVMNRDSIYSFKQLNGYLNNLANGDIAGFRNDKFSIAVNPLFDLLFAYDLQQKQTVFETGFGGSLEAVFWNKIGLGFNYRAYRGDPVSYSRNRVNERLEVPGYSMAKGLDGNVVRSQEFDAYLNITPNEFISVEGGYGNQFWGDGYRSFFLSDNASSYPYFKFTLDFWRIKYVYLFTVLKYGTYDLPSNTFNIADPKKKYGVFHYLSIDAAKWFQFGFFEGVVWKRADSTGVRGVEWNYLNPVVFIRPVEFAIGSPDNVILGMNFKFKMGDRNQLYTQLILDDLDIGSARQGSGFYRTKVAWQIGYRSYDLFKIEHLDFQSEFNMSRPFVFAHKTPEQNYAHLNQEMAHPLGANFWEWLVFVKYRKDRWTAALNFQWARQGGDDISNRYNDHNGSNIFVSDYEIVDNIPENLDFAYGNEFLQGVLNDIAKIEVSGGYLLNPKLNMQVDVFVQHRVRNIPDFDISEKNTLIGIRFATRLFNRYDDF
ncbi:MAG: hypothetical protein GY751_05510 [Bacteroidetes bacterium]|nr:hypothetical protein [Bacteroidota bacterium]